MDAQGVSGLEHLLAVLAHKAGVGDVARLHVIAHAGPDRRDVGAVETVPHALLAVHHRLQGGVQLLDVYAMDNTPTTALALPSSLARREMIQDVPLAPIHPLW